MNTNYTWSKAINCLTEWFQFGNLKKYYLFLHSTYQECMIFAKIGDGPCYYHWSEIYAGVPLQGKRAELLGTKMSSWLRQFLSIKCLKLWVAAQFRTLHTCMHICTCAICVQNDFQKVCVMCTCANLFQVLEVQSQFRTFIAKTDCFLQIFW